MWDAQSLRSGCAVCRWGDRTPYRSRARCSAARPWSPILGRDGQLAGLYRLLRRADAGGVAIEWLAEPWFAKEEVQGQAMDVGKTRDLPGAQRERQRRAAMARQGRCKQDDVSRTMSLLVAAQAPSAAIDAQVCDGWSDRRRINSLWEVLRANSVQREPARGDLRTLVDNHVLVHGEPGAAVFAHLRRGSIRVEPGQRIASRHRIARAGNSTMPHLHCQVMDGADPRHVAGVYCGFRCADARREPVVPLAMVPFQASPPAEHRWP